MHGARVLGVSRQRVASVAVAEAVWGGVGLGGTASVRRQDAAACCALRPSNAAGAQRVELVHVTLGGAQLREVQRSSAAVVPCKCAGLPLPGAVSTWHAREFLLTGAPPLPGTVLQLPNRTGPLCPGAAARCQPIASTLRQSSRYALHVYFRGYWA